MGRSEARGGGTEGRRGTRRRQAAGTAERGQRAARGHRGKVADQFLVTDLTVGGDGGGVGPLWTSRLHRWRPASTVDPSPAVNPPWRDARGGGCGPCCLGTKSVRTALLTWRSGGEGGGGGGSADDRSRRGLLPPRYAGAAGALLLRARARLLFSSLPPRPVPPTAPLSPKRDVDEGPSGLRAPGATRCGGW